MSGCSSKILFLFKGDKDKYRVVKASPTNFHYNKRTYVVQKECANSLGETYWMDFMHINGSINSDLDREDESNSFIVSVLNFVEDMLDKKERELKTSVNCGASQDQEV